RRQLLLDFNSSAADLPDPPCVHRLFERQAASRPDAIALTAEADAGPSLSLSYRELNGRANQLARHLLGLGLGPDQLAAVCLPRSPELIIAWLGVLKAGGAYLPLEADQPAERLAHQMEESGALLLVSNSELAGRLPAGWAQVVCLDEEGAVIAGHSRQDVQGWATGEQLAYVMYTSGSTGRPKGIAVPHRGVARLARGQFARLDCEQVFLPYAPAGFDASTFEVWGALCNGGRVAVTGGGGGGAGGGGGGGGARGGKRRGGRGG